MRKVFGLACAVVLLWATAGQAATELFVSSGGDVLKYDLDVSPPTGATFASGLSTALEIEIGPDFNGDGVEDLYVAERFAQIGVRSGVDGSSLGSLGTGLSQPRGVSIGPDGNLYVNDRSNDRVVKIDLPGGVQSDFATNASAGIDGGYELEWVGDQLYVTNEGQDVLILDTAGNLVTTIETLASSTAVSSNVGFAFADNGDVYISQRQENTVIKFEAASNTITTVLLASATGLDGNLTRDILFGPDLNGDGAKDLLLANGGNIYAVDIEDGVLGSPIITGLTGENWMFIPEPATLALLSLGGLALLRRRR